LSAMLGRRVELVDRGTVEQSRNYLRRHHILRTAESIYAEGCSEIARITVSLGRVRCADRGLCRATGSVRTADTTKGSARTSCRRTRPSPAGPRSRGRGPGSRPRVARKDTRASPTYGCVRTAVAIRPSFRRQGSGTSLNVNSRGMVSTLLGVSYTSP
jgi:hypothetical protein